MRPRLGAVAVLAILALLALMHVSAGQSVGAPSAYSDQFISCTNFATHLTLRVVGRTGKPKAPPQLPPKPKAPPLPPKPPQPPKTPQPAQPPPSHPPKDRAAEDSGKQAEAAREAQAQAEEEAQSAAKAERERQQAVKAEARAIAEAAERKAQGQSAAAIAEEELVAQEQATAAAAAAAAEVAALTRNTAESDSTDDENAATDDAGDNDNEDDGGDGDREHGGDGEEADTNYVEPHIEVPGIPYMAADAHGGSHMEECHRSRTRLARSRLEKYFWPGECAQNAPSGSRFTCPICRRVVTCGVSIS
jgi:outer membrane biosynthesis protein TonB